MLKEQKLSSKSSRPPLLCSQIASLLSNYCSMILSRGSGKCGNQAFKGGSVEETVRQKGLLVDKCRNRCQCTNVL